LKIAILTELFPPSVGGQEIRFAEISRVLTHHGHSVHVFCIRNIPGTPTEEVSENVAIHRYPAAYDYQLPTFKWMRRRPFVVLSYALWCRRIDPRSFDLFIFNQWPLAHIVLARPAMRSRSVIDWCEFRGGSLFAFLQRRLPRLVSDNLANNMGLKERLEQSSGRRFEYLPSGIYTERYRCAPAAQRHGILYLGRLAEHKNLPLMLSSYECLASQGYRGRLRIAGSGPALSKLQHIAAVSAVSDRVDFMGFVSEEQKLELLATSEVLLLTSRREGFPRVIAEAMASGLPTVTVEYPENGAKDVVRQYEIGQVAEPTPEALSEKVLGVLANWNLYSRCCLSASKSLDWEVLVDKLLQMASATRAS
jgi:glycosyltransferase involved in cell wall biosynthesis